MKRTVAASVAVAGSAVATSGTAGTIRAAQSSDGSKVVRMNTTTAVGNHFNPLWFIGTGSQWHSFPFIWLPLVFYNAEGQMEPWLAESIDASPDATTYTFHLHQNGVWSDGTPVTAADVKFTYELIMNPATAEIGNIGASLVGIRGLDAFTNGEADGIEGIEVVDDYTVRFTLDAPNAIFLYDCTLFVMPKHVLGDTAIGDLPNHPYVDNPTVTSGPFRLANYQPQQLIELEAWPDYWGVRKPKIDRLVLVQVDGPSVMNMLEAGELDFGVYLTTDDVARLEGLDTVTTIPTLSSGFATLYVNGRKDYLKDRRVRQALLYAIDRGPLNDLMYGGQALPINSSIIGPEWAVSPNLEPYEYDPERASQLLTEVGWDLSQVLTYWTDESSDPQAAYVQAMLQAIGITVEIKTEAFAAVTDRYESNSFDLASHGGGLHALDPGFAASGVICSASWSQWHGYCNPDVDELFAAGAASTDQSIRQEAYWRAGEILNQDLPYLYLFRPPTTYAINNRLQGFTAPISFRFANTSLLDWDITE